MLNVGLTSGAAQIDYFPIINLFRAVLPYTLHLNMEESKSLIPSANGLSIYDVALILPKIKLRSLSLMSCILRSPPASLSKIGTGILQPLSSLIQLPRSTKILFTSMMSCFGQAVSCFPTLAILSGGDGIGALVEFFQAEIENMISPDTYDYQDKDEKKVIGSSSSNSSSNMGSFGADTTDGPLILEVLELILLHCGHRMDKRKRDNIEKLIAVALLSLCKGIVHPSTVNAPGQSAWNSDRRLKRSYFEPIRYHARLQLALLRLAMTEVLSPKSDGSISGNIVLLRKAAEICCQHDLHSACPSLFDGQYQTLFPMQTKDPSFSSLSYEAARILLKINSILQPLTVPLSNSSLRSVTLREEIYERKEMLASRQKTGDDMTTAEQGEIHPKISDSNSSESIFGAVPTGKVADTTRKRENQSDMTNSNDTSVTIETKKQRVEGIVEKETTLTSAEGQHESLFKEGGRERREEILVGTSDEKTVENAMTQIHKATKAQINPEEESSEDEFMNAFVDADPDADEE